MQKLLLAEGATEIGVWSFGIHAFLEIEYIRLSKGKFGQIGPWFWLELFSIISVLVVFVCFAWIAGSIH